MDSDGNTIEYFLSENRDVKAAKAFLNKALGAKHNHKQRVITTDKYAATIKTIKTLPECSGVKHRDSKYMNNITEQDHRRIKRKTSSMLGLKSFESASTTIDGIEVFQMIKKNQISDIRTALNEVNFIEQIFAIA